MAFLGFEVHEGQKITAFVFDPLPFVQPYTIRFSNAVYVLHTFQKKSKKSIATPKQDMALIKSRLKLAEEGWKKETTS
jgi:hypothetical protein